MVLTMKYKLILVSLLALIIQLPSSVSASPYFSTNKIYPQYLDKPYADGSKERKDEIAQIIKMQKNADKAEIKKAAEEREIDSGMLITKIDKKYTRKAYPNLYKLLDKTLQTALGESGNIKNYWKVQRPYIADKRIKTLIKPHENYSYPSGHTTVSFLWAEVLSDLIPAKKKHILAQAESISNHRVLVGMHYPSDITAGKKLAEAIFKKLQHNQDYQQDFSSAEIELNK